MRRFGIYSETCNIFYRQFVVVLRWEEGKSEMMRRACHTTGIPKLEDTCEVAGRTWYASAIGATNKNIHINNATCEPEDIAEMWRVYVVYWPELSEKATVGAEEQLQRLLNGDGVGLWSFRMVAL